MSARGLASRRHGIDSIDSNHNAVLENWAYAVATAIWVPAASIPSPFRRGFLIRDLPFQGVVLLLFAVAVEQQGWARHRVGEMGVETGFINVVEESRHPVEILLRDGIVLVVVAARAAHGEPEPHLAHCAHAIDQVLRLKLFGDAAGFGIDAVIALEPGRDFLFEHGVRQQVAGAGGRFP